MKNLAGKVAVVTGGGSGIGEALVRAFADEGMHVAVADIEEEAAKRVAEDARAKGVQALAVRTDVADPAALQALADTVSDELGGCDILCNNAGVLLMGPSTGNSLEDWQWLLSVNVMGVVNGVHAFLPQLRTRKGGAHIVNTGSVAAIGGGGVYGASKAAVVAYSESLRNELAEAGIGVSVLCPSYVNSKILGAQRNRPARFGARADEPMGNAEVTTGLPPSAVARDTLRAIREGHFYVFTLPQLMLPRTRPPAERRFEEILSAIDRGVHDNPA